MNVVCHQCLAVNRVPETRLHDGPICAKCKTVLLPTHPIDLTDASFSKFVTRTQLPVLVDFWASWCGPCRMMAPEFAKAAGQLSPRMILAKLDTEAAPQSAGQFSITGIPTLILFQQGQEIARQSGAMNAQQILQWVAST